MSTVTGEKGKIHRPGVNYVIAITEEGTMFRAWVKDIRDINYQESIQDAIRSIPVKENDIILITGSLYLAGEVLNLN